MQYLLKQNKLSVEHMLLSTIINNRDALPTEQKLIQAYKLDAELFTSNNTIRLVAKAIKALQDSSKVVDDLSVLIYLKSKQAKFSEQDFINIISASSCTYTTFKAYVEQLKNINLRLLKQEQLEVIGVI